MFVRSIVQKLAIAEPSCINKQDNKVTRQTGCSTINKIIQAIFAEPQFSNMVNTYSSYILANCIREQGTAVGYNLAQDIFQQSTFDYQ